MSNETIDWADVAALGLVMVANGGCSIPEAVSVIGAHGLRDHADRHCAFAAALREAFEAGLRESGNLYTEHSLALDRLLEQAEELAALRRELSARRAVDGWLRDDEGMRALGVLDGLLTAILWPDDDGQELHCQAPTYPALAAALGLEVEDE